MGSFGYYYIYRPKNKKSKAARGNKDFESKDQNEMYHVDGTMANLVLVFNLCDNICIIDFCPG